MGRTTERHRHRRRSVRARLTRLPRVRGTRSASGRGSGHPNGRRVRGQLRSHPQIDGGWRAPWSRSIPWGGLWALLTMPNASWPWCVNRSIYSARRNRRSLISAKRTASPDRPGLGPATRWSTMSATGDTGDGKRNPRVMNGLVERVHGGAIRDVAGHALQHRRDRDLVVGELRRWERILIDPLVAE